MNIRDLVDQLGGQAQVARMMNLRAPSVNEWVKQDKIPKFSRVLLAVKAEELGVITRKQLFPNDYQDIWPELR